MIDLQGCRLVAIGENDLLTLDPLYEVHGIQILRDNEDRPHDNIRAPVGRFLIMRKFVHSSSTGALESLIACPKISHYEKIRPPWSISIISRLDRENVCTT